MFISADAPAQTIFDPSDAHTIIGSPPAGVLETQLQERSHRADKARVSRACDGKQRQPAICCPGRHPQRLVNSSRHELTRGVRRAIAAGAALRFRVQHPKRPRHARVARSAGCLLKVMTTPLLLTFHGKYGSSERNHLVTPRWGAARHLMPLTSAWPDVGGIKRVNIRAVVPLTGTVGTSRNFASATSATTIRIRLPRSPKRRSARPPGWQRWRSWRG